MEVTREYLSLPPWEALISMINHHHHLLLDDAYTELMDSTPLPGERLEVTLFAPRSTRTGNLLPAGDTWTFEYQRLNLGTFFGTDPTAMPELQLPIDTTEIARVLSERTGVVFDGNDFFHQRLTSYGATQSLYLQAHPRSLRWTGGLTISIERQPLALDSVFTDTALGDVLASPAGVHELTQGPLYLMAEDFTAYRNLLAAFSPNSTDRPPSDLLTILDERTRHPWVCEATVEPWNLASRFVVGQPYYTVLHNGAVSTTWTPRTDLANVLVIDLSASFTANVAGHLLFHYD